MPIVPERTVPIENQNKKAELLTKYVNVLWKTAQDYQTVIDHFSELLRDIRNERKNFFDKDIPAIRKKLTDDEVSKEKMEKWIDELKDNMEKSFKTSEDLVREYITESRDEYKKKLEDAIMRV